MGFLGLFDFKSLSSERGRVEAVLEAIFPTFRSIAEHDSSRFLWLSFVLGDFCGLPLILIFLSWLLKCCFKKKTRIIAKFLRSFFYEIFGSFILSRGDQFDSVPIVFNPCPLKVLSFFPLKGISVGGDLC